MVYYCNALCITSTLNVHTTPANIHTGVMWSPLNNNIVKTLLKRFYHTDTYIIFCVRFFISPKWLHVRLNIVPGLTFDSLVEKKIFTDLVIGMTTIVRNSLSCLFKHLSSVDNSLDCVTSLQHSNTESLKNKLFNDFFSCAHPWCKKLWNARMMANTENRRAKRPLKKSQTPIRAYQTNKEYLGFLHRHKPFSGIYKLSSAWGLLFHNSCIIYESIGITLRHGSSIIKGLCMYRHVNTVWTKEWPSSQVTWMGNRRYSKVDHTC